MSDWRDKLRPGSFRNVPFVFSDGDAEFGRRNVVHEYPLRDKPWVEDLGRKVRNFSLTAFVLGDNYMDARDALIAAIETPGTGELIHPRYGRLNVSITSCRQRESTRDGGYAQFNLSFSESGEKEFPSSVIDTPVVVEAAADVVIQKSVEEFTADFNVENATSFVIQDAIDKVQSLATDILTINTKINSALQPLSDLAAATDSLTDQAEKLISQPASLGNAIVGVVQTMVGAVVETNTSFKRAISGPYGSLVNTQKLAINNIVTVKPILTSLGRLRAESNSVQIRQLVDRVAEAEACRSVSQISFDSYEESAALRTARYTGIEMLLPSARIHLYHSLKTLRHAVVDDVIQRGGNLSRFGHYQPSSTLPALVLAHQLYGDANKADDIIKRNKIKHPCFIPGGQMLEIRSE